MCSSRDFRLVHSSVLYPAEVRSVFEISCAKSIPLEAAEHASFGFTHCETGAIVAQEWRLPPEVTEVVLLRLWLLTSKEGALGLPWRPPQRFLLGAMERVI
jgi:hypothetical protein